MAADKIDIVNMLENFFFIFTVIIRFKSKIDTESEHPGRRINALIDANQCIIIGVLCYFRVITGVSGQSQQVCSGKIEPAFENLIFLKRLESKL